MRLDEHNRAFGIEARRVQSDGHVDGPLGEARRVVGLRDGVQVHDREQAIMLVLQLDPVLDGAEVVADVQLARGLDAGKDACHGVTTYDCGARPRKVRELKDLVDAARIAAARAAILLRRATPAAARDWIEKARHDFVTEADRQSEALIAETLTAAVPGSHVVGEELSPTEARAGDGGWIVDPPHGTTTFLPRHPQYAVSIGALVEGTLRVGVIYDVARDLVYWGATGLGAWPGGRQRPVSGLTQPRPALLGPGVPFPSPPA